MSQVARIGDKTDHGGQILTGSDEHTVDDIQVARVGDMVSCPIIHHGVNPIITGSVTSSVDDGKAIALVGSKTACGATIITGSNSTSME